MFDLLSHHVRFGSLADITARSRHVRFTPNSGHSSVRVGCPKSAKSGHPSTRWPYQDRLLGLAATGQSLTFRHIEFVLVVSRFELE